MAMIALTHRAGTARSTWGSGGVSPNGGLYQPEAPPPAVGPATAPPNEN